MPHPHTGASTGPATPPATGRHQITIAPGQRYSAASEAFDALLRETGRNFVGAHWFIVWDEVPGKNSDSPRLSLDILERSAPDCATFCTITVDVDATTGAGTATLSDEHGTYARTILVVQDPQKALALRWIKGLNPHLGGLPFGPISEMRADLAELLVAMLRTPVTLPMSHPNGSPVLDPDGNPVTGLLHECTWYPVERALTPLRDAPADQLRAMRELAPDWSGTLPDLASTAALASAH